METLKVFSVVMTPNLHISELKSALTSPENKELESMTVTQENVSLFFTLAIAREIKLAAGNTMYTLPPILYDLFPDIEVAKNTTGMIKNKNEPTYLTDISILHHEAVTALVTGAPGEDTFLTPVTLLVYVTPQNVYVGHIFYYHNVNENNCLLFISIYKSVLSSFPKFSDIVLNDIKQKAKSMRLPCIYTRPFPHMETMLLAKGFQPTTYGVYFTLPKNTSTPAASNARTRRRRRR